MENEKLRNLVKEERETRQKKKGFSLVELIIVIAILGILAAIITPNVAKFTDSAKISRAVSDAKTIVSAVDAYKAEQEGGTASAIAIDLANTNLSTATGIVGADASIKTWPKELTNITTYNKLLLVADKGNYDKTVTTSGSAGTKWGIDASGNVVIN